jgi:hypothetical protein
MQLTNTQIGIIAGLAITGVVVYYFVKKGNSNALPAGMARFAKCKNGTTVKIVNQKPCENKGGIEKVFTAPDTPSTNTQPKPNTLPSNIQITKPTLEQVSVTKPTIKGGFAPIEIVDVFVK